MFRDDLVNDILARISSGESLRSICRDDGMPCQVTVFRWIQERPGFLERYAMAREMQADSLFEEILDAGRVDPATSRTYDEAGAVISEKVDSGEVQHRKLKIDTLKWAASKLRPKKYGDTTNLQVDATHKHYVATIPERARSLDDWAKEVQGMVRADAPALTDGSSDSGDSGDGGGSGG